MRTQKRGNSAIHASPSKASANSKNQFSMERSPVGREHGHVESGIVGEFLEMRVQRKQKAVCEIYV